MPAALDLASTRFGKLLVLDRTQKDRNGAWMWLCRCDCGREVNVRGATLKAGRTSACQSCAAITRNTTHGETGSALYARWRAMLDRCENPNHRAWKNYGGRGIKICEEWHQYAVFARDMGSAFESHLELDRINVDGYYEPANCRWVTHADQQSNKRTNHTLTWRGRTLTATKWASVLGLNPNTLIYRLRRGWSLDRAMTHGVPESVLLKLTNPGWNP